MSNKRPRNHILLHRDAYRRLTKAEQVLESLYKVIDENAGICTIDLEGREKMIMVQKAVFDGLIAKNAELTASLGKTEPTAGVV